MSSSGRHWCTHAPPFSQDKWFVVFGAINDSTLYHGGRLPLRMYHDVRPDGLWQDFHHVWRLRELSGDTTRRQEFGRQSQRSLDVRKGVGVIPACLRDCCGSSSSSRPCIFDGLCLRFWLEIFRRTSLYFHGTKTRRYHLIDRAVVVFYWLVFLGAFGW